jgi:hypothetical protein
MADILSAEACCGLRELDGLSSQPDTIKAMREIATQMYGELLPKGVKGTNPYKKPKDKVWQGTNNLWGTGRWWMKDDGTRVYEYQASDWEETRRYGGYEDHDNTWRYAVFTQAGTRKTYGKKFAALIKKENLGEVVQATTKSVKNPNSGNVLKAWIWTVNHRNLRAWAQKQANLQLKEK